MTLVAADRHFRLFVYFRISLTNYEDVVVRDVHSFIR